MKMTIGEIAAFLGGTVIGSEDIVIHHIRAIEEAHQGDLTFIANKKYLKKLKDTKASAILVSPQTTAEGKNLIVVADPYVALGKILNHFYPPDHGGHGVTSEA